MKLILLQITVMLASVLTVDAVTYSPEEIELIFSRSTYCGVALEQTLATLCNHLYAKKTAVFEFESDGEEQLSHQIQARDVLLGRVSEGKLMRHRRGAKHVCCSRGCSNNELQEYCLYPPTTRASMTVAVAV